MQDELLTDQQQAEKFRGWLRENGPYLVAGILLGLGGLFGWNQWKSYQERQAEAASAVYEDLRKAVAAQRIDEALAELGELEAEYGRSPYLDQGRLLMARVYVDRSDTDQAVTYLRQVVDHADAPPMRNIARVRLARLLASQEKYDEALQALVNPESATFSPMFHDVRGDVYQAKGQADAARSEYEQALNSETAALVIDRSYVQAKLDALGGPAAGLVAAAGNAAPAAPAPAATAPAPAKPEE